VSTNGCGGFQTIGSGLMRTFGQCWALRRHAVSGAEVLFVEGKGEDRFFGFSFVTPPSDSRGVPHVLEHCVLNGSRRYPVRDAFNELWRGSLHSSLNASTGPDRTIYYAGSPSPADFRNILGVYLDLLFDPLLDPRRVALESFHYRPVKSRGGLYASPSGVIYSEMRGSYSDPDEVSSLRIQASILPDTPYRHDPGGDPSDMHRLTYEDILQYHRRFYRPSNCMLFLYAPEPWDELAPLVAPFLGRPDGPREEGLLPLQRRWKRPRSVRIPIPGGDRQDGAALNMSWLLGEVSDSEGTALGQLLEDVLLSDAGPLCLALQDSGLGTDLSTETGVDLEVREAVITAGLRGCRESSAARVRSLVLRSLEEFAGKGPDTELVEASVNNLMTRYSERVEELPMRLFLRALRGWTYGAGPGPWLDHAESVGRLADGDVGRRLASAARTLLLENPHRLDSRTVPAGRTGSGREKLERLRIEAFESLRERNGELEEYASAAEIPENLSTIPRLDPFSLPDEPRFPPARLGNAGGADILVVPAQGSAMAYMEAAFDVSQFGTDDQMLLPLLGRCLQGMPAPGMPYEKVALALARLSGGLECDLLALPGPGGAAAWLLLSASGFVDRFEELISFLFMLFGRALDDPDRFDHSVSEMYGDARSDLVPNCDSFARLAAAASVRPSSLLFELWEGMTQVEMLEALYDSPGASARARSLMTPLASRALRRDRALFALSAGEESCPGLEAAIAGLTGSLSSGPPEGPCGFEPRSARKSLIRWNTSVSSACLCGPAPLLRDEDAALFTVGTAVLSDGLLYNELRTAAGAYEVSAWHDRISGVLTVCSYRDPDPARTLDSLRRADRFLRDSPPSEEDVRLGILAAFAPLERPSSTRGNLLSSVFRRISGIDLETSRRFRSDLKKVTREAVMERYLPLLRESIESAGLGVVAPRSASPDAIFGDVGGEVEVFPRKSRGWRFR